MDAVNRRIEQLLGPLGPWLICPHAPQDRCGCRKPLPTLVLRAAQHLDLPAAIASWWATREATSRLHAGAGAQPILISSEATPSADPTLACPVARNLAEAVDVILRQACPPPQDPGSPRP